MEQPRVEKILGNYINKVAQLEYQIEVLNDLIEQRNERIAELESEREDE